MGLLKTLFRCFSTSDPVADCGSCSYDYENLTKNNKYSWEQIKTWSSNFSRVIGTGGVSTVYLARLPNFGLAAIKLQSVCTERLARIHEQELQILVQLKHPNIVKFIGHCHDDREEERGLVLEYASNGTLHDKLRGFGKSLTWKTRTLIALQLASALQYLHGMQIIHGDIKASNILLDQYLNCKLCDFGSAKLGLGLPSPRQAIIGSQGYMDPDYFKTGLVSKKNDIYSLGVVLFELVTGREAFSVERGELLTEIIGPVVRGVLGVEEVLDPRLIRYGGGLDLDLEEAKAMVSMAGMCIGCSMIRPCANQIVASIKDKFQIIS